MRKPKRKLNTILDIKSSCVINDSGCWNWPWASSRHGYGCGTINNKRIVIHRWSYHLANPNEDITTKVICHKCDNVKCCNPDHLFSGTQVENLHDMKSKKRGFQKISDEDRIKIINRYKEEKLTTRDLGKIYNVSFSTIAKIVKVKS